MGQPAPGGGQWVQLEGIAGIGCVELRRQCGGGSRDSGPAQLPSSHSGSGDPLPLQHPVVLEPAPDLGPGRWRLGNGLVTAVVGPGGVEQLLDRHGAAQLAAPLTWRRCSDRGEFWDAWDLAPADRRCPLPWLWQEAPKWIEAGPLCGRFRLRRHLGARRPCLARGHQQHQCHPPPRAVSARRRTTTPRLAVPTGERGNGGVIEQALAVEGSGKSVRPKRRGL